MKRYLPFFIMTVLLLIVSCAGTPDTAVKSTESPEETPSEPRLEEVSFSFAGIWMGELEAGGTKFTIVFKIEKQNEGKYTGSWDSPDQKMTDMYKNQEKDAATNIKAHDAILEKIEGQQKCIMNQSHKFVSSRLFYWLLGFIIIGLVGIGGVTADNNSKISSLETQVEMINTNGDM